MRSEGANTIQKHSIMKKIIILSAAALVALSSCGNRNQQKKTEQQAAATEQATTAADTHNSRNSLDWPGIYEGTVPCADCPGIRVKVTLEADGSYSKTMAYMEKPNIFITKGTFSWDDTGSRITLTDGQESEIYKVGENRLTMLDQQGNAITGDLADMYILKKQ